MMMRRLARPNALVAFVALLALILSACGSADSTTSAGAGAASTEAAASTGTATESVAPATSVAAASAATTGGGGTEVTFWSRDSTQNLIEPLITQFNSSHATQIKVTFIPADQYIQKLATAFAGNEAPDLIAVDLIYMPSFAAAGQVTDITDQAKALPFFDQLSPSHMRLGTYEGKIYSLPFAAEGSILLYNKNLFREAGLDPEKPPTTLAEVAEYSRKITALGNGKYGFYVAGSCAGCNAFVTLPLIWASGGDVLNTEGTQATIASDPNVKGVLNWLHQQWADGQIPESAKVDNGTNFLNAFTAGNIGMAGSGAFSIATLKTKYPDVDFGVTPLPGLTGGSASFAGGDTIAIPSGSEHVTEAFEFINWFLSEEVQVEYLAKNGGLPLRLDLVENKYTKEDPRYVTVANAMFKTGRTPYLLRYNEIFNNANGPWLAMLQKSIFDGQVDAALPEAQDAFTSILSE